GIELAVISPARDSMAVMDSAHLPVELLSRITLPCALGLSHTIVFQRDRAERCPPAESGGDVVQLAGLRRAARALRAVRTESDRTVGAAGALRRGDHSDPYAGAARGSFHAARRLGSARVAGDVPSLRPRFASGRRGLAERVWLVQHRRRGLL